MIDMVKSAFRLQVKHRSPAKRRSEDDLMKILNLSSRNSEMAKYPIENFLNLF